MACFGGRFSEPFVSTPNSVSSFAGPGFPGFMRCDCLSDRSPSLGRHPHLSVSRSSCPRHLTGFSSARLDLCGHHTSSRHTRLAPEHPGPGPGRKQGGRGLDQPGAAALRAEPGCREKVPLAVSGSAQPNWGLRPCAAVPPADAHGPALRRSRSGPLVTARNEAESSA